MPATAQQPNIILITTDQQRWDTMSLNNPQSSLRTPTLDSLAASGVNFTKAYTTCPVCIPARRSLLCGLHPHSHGLRGYQDGLDWDPPFTLPGLLGQSGYQTQLIGKLHLHPQRKRYGFDHMVRMESPNDRWDTPLQPVNDWVDWMKEQGYPHPNSLGINGNGRNARPWDKEESLHLTNYTTAKAVDFVTKYRDPSCPFFMHLSYWAPHPPLIPPQAYWDRHHGHHNFQPTISSWTPDFQDYPRGIPDDATKGPFCPEEIHNAAAGYYGLISHIDDQIRYFLTRLFEYGSPRAKEPTYIIFTSDHGEMMGDHHLWRKSMPYEGSSHVPFFISGRNVEITPGSSDALVTLEDVVATSLDLAGCEIPDALSPEIESTSLTPNLSDASQATREQIFGECTGINHHFIVKGQYKYIWFAKTQEEQLFDLNQDPMEEQDLSAQTELLTSFRASLKAHLETRDDYNFDEALLQPCKGQAPKAIWN